MLLASQLFTARQLERSLQLRRDNDNYSQLWIAGATLSVVVIQEQLYGLTLGVIWRLYDDISIRRI